MKAKRITLKDIAEYCGVSPTIVSVVLNGREGHIACADECRNSIRAAAKKLGYRPNLLARSMVDRRVPLVGVMLHLTEEDFSDGVNGYLQQVLPELTFQFNRHDLEVIFIPYSSEEEQVRRAENLIGYGMAGGIVTNIIPGANRRIGAFLKSSETPHMILGKPDDPAGLFYSYRTFDYQAMLKDYTDRHGFRRIYLVTQKERRMAYYRFPLAGNYLWNAEETTVTSREMDSDEALFLLMGKRIVRQIRKISGTCRHAVLVETAGADDDWREDADMPFLLMRPRRDLPEIADMLAAWVLHGKVSPRQEFHREAGAEAIVEQYLP